MYWTNKFNEFNKKFWDGKLTKIPVKIRDLSSDRAEGLYHYPDEEEGTESYIEIDKKLTHHQKLNILLHEMCHHAVEVFYEERPYHNHGKEWKEEMRELAKCSNVYAKIGGLAMPDNGFDWHLAERPPTSDEFVAAQGRYYHHMIECFGPERCMFESNFPVDRLSISYPVLWNALKKIASRYSESEQQALFSGTASNVYKL